MEIKEVIAKKVYDSRKQETIVVYVKSEIGTFLTSSPSGKSKGKYETPAFPKSVDESIKMLLGLSEKLKEIKIKEFADLIKVEAIVRKEEIGANTLYALEASILKALAAEHKKELWEYLGGRRIPIPIGNIIGGGLHTQPTGGKRADFQEFLIIPRMKNIVDNIKIMKKAHELVGERLKLRDSRGKLNDENAWSTSLGNEGCLEVLNETREEISREIDHKIEIGIDVASSSFYSGLYQYKNPERFIGDDEQVKYIHEIINKYNLFYVEDPLSEDDFKNFKNLREIVEGKCLIVGDDLTVSKVQRLVMALKNRSISGIIVKPNQTGSLLEIKKLIEIAKKYNISTIMSHRSGETIDYTIADLAVGFETDFFKTGVLGDENEIKLKRLIDIEKRI